MLNHNDIKNDIDISLESFRLQILQTREVNKLICIRHRIDVIGLFNMTPEEELFKDLFNGEKILVSSMDTLTLRAHREHLVEIVRHGKVKLLAVDDEEKTRAKNRKFSDTTRSTDIDETSTNAINAIKKRQGKIDKFDKIRDGLIKMGMSAAEADKVMSARNILDQTKKSQNITSPEEAIKSITEIKTESKPIFNPFDKK